MDNENTPPNFPLYRPKRMIEEDLPAEFNKKDEMRELFTSFISTQQSQTQGIIDDLKETQLTNYNIENSIALLTSQNEQFQQKIESLEGQAKKDQVGLKPKWLVKVIVWKMAAVHDVLGKVSVAVGTIVPARRIPQQARTEVYIGRGNVDTKSIVRRRRQRSPITWFQWITRSMKHNRQGVAGEGPLFAAEAAVMVAVVLRYRMAARAALAGCTKWCAPVPGAAGVGRRPPASPTAARARLAAPTVPNRWSAGGPFPA
ncbi:unnamed protein product [Chilo suppressalis]|uniref:Uncharacterized protein n=1 Tax=Chilo suppressalis TaxID=168631 RepID=A0ABN8BER4_CHISP|nr:unnamed protein product [Chilo suppressalis]